jgi:7,8-dihydropterin-6-yl-methyl-4-(beta-D-ribofuranosyl)aminobenzene 5'-phosphate synthase
LSILLYSGYGKIILHNLPRILMVQPKLCEWIYLMTHELNEISKLEVFVLMDNISDPFTTSHDGLRWNEFQYQFGVRKQKEMCGASMCRACNGLSLLLKLHTADKTYTLLFDTGPDEGLVVENAKRLGLDLTTVEAIVLSHGHFDHFGGTLSVLNAIGKQNLPVYVHPELFLPRAFTKKEMIKVGDILTAEQIEAHGGKVIADTKPVELFNKSLLITGEVPRNTVYETSNPNENRLRDGKWIKSPDIIDERCLVLNLKGKGICVFTGCGHTGVINAIKHSKTLLNLNKVHLIMGGFHLAGREYANRIDPTIADLKKINPNFIVTGHCTGRQMQSVLTATFAEQHIPYGVGTVFQFQ